MQLCWLCIHFDVKYEPFQCLSLVEVNQANMYINLVDLLSQQAMVYKSYSTDFYKIN